MMEKLREKVKESLSSVLPITIIVLLLSILLIPMGSGSVFPLSCRSGISDLRDGILSARCRHFHDAARTGHPADSLSKNEIFYLLSVDAS